jgi:pullulanase-type alpha-1,6-glucosidase
MIFATMPSTIHHDQETNMKRKPSPRRMALTIALLLAILLPPTLLPSFLQRAVFAQDVATIHYHRPDNAYDGWGLHVWLDSVAETLWAEPLVPTGVDGFGIYWQVPLQPGAAQLDFIVHNGDIQDPGVDMRLDLTSSTQAWVLSGDSTVYTEQPDLAPLLSGDLTKARAQWVTEDTIAWPTPPEGLPADAQFTLLDAPSGEMQLTVDGIQASDISQTPLTLDAAGLDAVILARFPHLNGYSALKLPSDALDKLPALLKSQLAVQVQSPEDDLLDASGVQTAAVLDELFAWDGPLGVTWEDGAPTLRVWAPTAKRVRLLLYDDSTSAEPAQIIPMGNSNGVWSVSGPEDWKNKFYLLEVRVILPASGEIVVNQVTDPYSLSLSTNSTRSQFVDLNDPELAPEGWSNLVKPSLNAPEDITLYELHLRDFSAYDASVPDEHRGSYLAFTDSSSVGMTHLQTLAAAGLSHVHLLPTFDFATIDEDKSTWTQPDPADLQEADPDSQEQQAAVTETQAIDAYDWGYDPVHYLVPEGSYSTNPDGAARILEYRQMVQSLNQAGLRVVSDIVLNHTSAASQDQYSVLDKIVPGYYHRLNADGQLETSTCCANTATEHRMMRKLMLDAVRLWATQYKVDGFRFDLMGHHMAQDILAVRDMLDQLTLETDGVDGASIYIYGEGWDFGEVAENARGINASQRNMAGSGIGTFNDRLRDAVRGIGPFDTGADLNRQGFVSGLATDPNDYDWGSDEAAAEQLGLITDWIKIGMAGNLADYLLIDHNGNAVRGDEIDYNGAPAGYTADPQENVAYADAHDNQTLFDAVQLTAPADADIEERARMAQLGHAIVLLSQGVPFHQAGSEMLRSKSFDRNSYNSGDWFNYLDFTYGNTGFGRGLPLADSNEGDWSIMQPLLADKTLQPDPELVKVSVDHFIAYLRVRSSSPLFRLQTADEIKQLVRFHNVGSEAIPGLIVMSIADIGVADADIDPGLEVAVALINAAPDKLLFTEEGLAGAALELHPALEGLDRMDLAAFDSETGEFTIPGRTAVVWTAVDLPDDLALKLRAYDEAVATIRDAQPALAQEQTTETLTSEVIATQPATLPTATPTTAPTVAPTVAPTAAPAAAPTSARTTVPTAAPTAEPTDLPLLPTATPKPTAAAAPDSVSFPGTIAATVGGVDWDPSEPLVQASDPEGDGVWTLILPLPPGSFEFQAAVNGAVLGGGPVPLLVDAESNVLFVYEVASSAVYAMVDGVVVSGVTP